MPRFHFKLQRLLRVREVSEELARADVAVAERDAQSARASLAATRADLARAEQELTRLRTEASPAAAVLAERTLPPLLRRIVAGRLRVQSAEKAADQARAAWQERRTDVRALEKLEERERAEFAGEERAREDRALQEIIERRAALAGRKDLSTEFER
jgi:flagellar export protein FliJ